ncbi:hypothetical protein Y590_22070 [Methylobacterium sp. AMS5]|nr:hypothetical protein Y590_22070 [Methylobacterium sp. AMS5]
MLEDDAIALAAAELAEMQRSGRAIARENSKTRVSRDIRHGWFA